MRGLSSLLILRDLMKRVNKAIQRQKKSGERQGEVQLQDVFHVVAGTSTGGLIAIMLGKLAMTLNECIEAYYDLSKCIFGKKHLRGRTTLGLAVPKYSGTRLKHQTQELMKRKKLKETLSMVSEDGRDRMAW